MEMSHLIAVVSGVVIPLFGGVIGLMIKAHNGRERRFRSIENRTDQAEKRSIEIEANYNVKFAEVHGALDAGVSSIKSEIVTQISDLRTHMDENYMRRGECAILHNKQPYIT
jgi:hypothetical protein